MSWAKLDDGLWRNEKIIGCSDAALGLYLRALSYCADQRTDGRLSAHALKVLRASRVRAAELARVGLWDAARDGYAVHDYLKYNPSVSESDSKRHSKAMAGAKGAASRWHSRENAPDPDPDPVPDPENTITTRARTRVARELYAAVTGRQPENAVAVQMLDDIDFAHGPACVGWTFEAAATKGDPWPYAKRLFDSCLIEGHGPRGGNTNGRLPASGRPAGRVPGAGRGRKSSAGGGPDYDRFPDSDGFTD